MNEQMHEQLHEQMPPNACAGVHEWSNHAPVLREYWERQLWPQYYERILLSSIHGRCHNEDRTMDCTSTSFRSGQVWGSKWWVSRIPNTCPERKQVCMKRRSSCWHSDDLNCSSGDRCCVSCVNAVCNSDLGLTLCLLLCTCVLHVNHIYGLHWCTWYHVSHSHTYTCTCTLDSNVYISSVFNSHKALSHMRTLLRVISWHYANWFANPASNQYWYMGIVTYHAMFGHVRNFAQATVCKMSRLSFGKYWLRSILNSTEQHTCYIIYIYMIVATDLKT